MTVKGKSLWKHAQGVALLVTLAIPQVFNVKLLEISKATIRNLEEIRSRPSNSAMKTCPFLGISDPNKPLIRPAISLGGVGIGGELEDQVGSRVTA